MSALPNRYIGGIGIDPADSDHAFVAMGGFSRRWTEGPGAGVGHVFETDRRRRHLGNVDAQPARTCRPTASR